MTEVFPTAAERVRVALMLLIARYAENAAFISALSEVAERHVVALDRLLFTRVQHDDGHVDTLETWLLLAAEGLADPAEMRELERLARGVADSNLLPVLADIEMLVLGFGLRAPWAIGLILGALLRHELHGRTMPPGLAPSAIDPWPAGPRGVRSQLVSFESYWDPHRETRAEARSRMHARLDEQLDRIAAEVPEGRDLRLAAQALYRRVAHEQGWRTIARELGYEGAGRHSRNAGNSPNALKASVQRLADLLQLQLPRSASVA